MLPEFLIRLPDFDGLQVRCADVPAGVFFDGFPDDVPMTDCWLAADWNQQHAIAVGLQRWVTAVLARVVVEPSTFTPELVNRLGRDRAVLARGYFETVGWIQRNPDLVPVDVVTAPRGHGRRRSFALSSMTTPPGKNLRDRLRLMASRTRTQPAVLWGQPISEWLFNMRILADPQPDAQDLLNSSGVDT